MHGWTGEVNVKNQAASDKDIKGKVNRIGQQMSVIKFVCKD